MGIAYLAPSPQPPRSPGAPLKVRHLLRQFHLRPNKRLGQNFLVDEAALANVVAAARLEPDDVVLEVGPGVGSLTRWLAVNAARVVAVEIDARLMPALETVLAPYPNVRVVRGDVLALAPSDLVGEAPSYKVVANIPYYITSALMRHLLEAQPRPERMVLTVQREVAERVCAGPGEMSLLAVSVQFYGEPSIAAHIPADAFYPPPDVESAVVAIEVGPQPRASVADVDWYFEVVRAGFHQKRKQLRNSLAAGLGMPAETVTQWLQQAGVDPRRRAETLSLEEWEGLVRTSP